MAADPDVRHRGDGEEVVLQRIRQDLELSRAHRIIVLVWIASIPLWGVMFRDVIGAEDTETILGILYKLVPFYVAYALSTVFQAVLTSIGRTDYLFMESAFVNLVYYGIMYGLFRAGVFEASMDFIIMLFGFGMVLCVMLDVGFYLRPKKNIPQPASG